MENLVEKISVLIKNFASEESVIDENFDIRNELDSLSLVSFLLNVEDEFDVEIDMELLDLNNLKSIKVFATFLETL